MSRWQASAIHCGIGVLVLASIALLLATTWYPPLLAWAGGQFGLLGILYGVDVAAGPLLTLLVYKHGKPGMKFDLCVIALLQLLSLGYGLHVMYQARPVYIVYAVDRFELVIAVDILPENLAKATREDYRSLPLLRPQTIGLRLPTGFKEKSDLVFSAMKGGPDAQQLPQYYRPYADVAPEAAHRAQPLEKLMGRDDATRAELAAWLDGKGRAASSVKWLPLTAKAHDLTVLVDGESGEVLDILAVAPG